MLPVTAVSSAHQVQNLFFYFLKTEHRYMFQLKVKLHRLFVMLLEVYSTVIMTY